MAVTCIYLKPGRREDVMNIYDTKIFLSIVP